MKIKKEEIQTALEIVKPGLANNEIIEQSTSFAFFGNRVITYNDVLSISHPIPEMDLTGAIRAQELYEFLRRVKNSEIELTITENELLMKSGRARAGLLLQSEITLPLEEIKGKKDWHDIDQDFVENMMFIKDSAGRDLSRRVLTCIHVTESTMEASDGFQIMRLFTEQWPLENTLIPADVLPEIKKIEPNQVAMTPGWLHFRNGESTLLSCRIISDKFPKIDSHFEVSGKEISFSKKMSEILERAMVFTNQDHNIDEEIDLRLKGKKLLVQGKNDYGWFKEQTSVGYSGKDAGFKINPLLLKNILKRSNKCVLGKEKVKFQGEDWEYIAALMQSAQ